MDFSQIEALNNLLSAGQEDPEDFKDNSHSGSVLNPGNIGGSKEKKEVAKPYTKIQTTINERNTTGGTKPTKAATDIWSVDEVKDIVVDKKENRLEPEYEILFRQKVGAEDVYLGMSDMDPSSTKCQELLMKVKLPKTVFKDVSLDVTEQAVCVQTSKYFLYHYLPYPVNEKEGKAQWLSDKNILQIILPIIKEDPF